MQNKMNITKTKIGRAFPNAKIQVTLNGNFAPKSEKISATAGKIKDIKKLIAIIELTISINGYINAKETFFLKW